MSKRLVVLFFANPSAAKPNPGAVTIVRGKPSSLEDLLKQIQEHQMLPDLAHPHCKGKVLIGRENDLCILNQDSRHSSAINWTGTRNPSDFVDVIRVNSSKFFQVAQPA